MAGLLFSELSPDQSRDLNVRMVAGMRLILAVAALTVTVIDPSEPDRLVEATYSALSIHVLYSLVLAVLVFTDRTVFSGWSNNPYWLDVVWYLLFISLSSGTSSIFFFFFYFAILNASFLSGFSQGLKVTLVSAIGFTLIGYLIGPDPRAFELNRFVIRPLSLLFLGYLISFWGGMQSEQIRRLKLLRDIGLRSNPRFGAERALAINLEMLRDFYRAASCFLITAEGEPRSWMFRQTGGSIDGDKPAQEIDQRLAEQLLSLPPQCAVMYSPTRWSGLFGGDQIKTFDCERQRHSNLDKESVRKIAEQLDAKALLTAPVNFRGTNVGRIFIVADESHSLRSAELIFLIQVVDHFFPIVENIRVIDHLASDAADQERRMIARDIHDSIIQPFIGLQMGIDAVIESLDDSEDENPEHLVEKIHHLRTLTEKWIEDMRGYVSGLSRTRSIGSGLLPAVARYTEKFTTATGISVDIECSENVKVPDRLAGEIFQIIAEGLSNVRRHTQSPWAKISIEASNSDINVKVTNESAGASRQKFLPRSITERAAALGGNVRAHVSGEISVVDVEIPQ